MELAATFATRCGDAYRKASDRTRKLFNATVFERLDVKGGQLCHEQYRPTFDEVFTVSEFEYGTRVEVTSSAVPHLCLQSSEAAGSRACIWRRHGGRLLILVRAGGGFTDNQQAKVSSERRSPQGSPKCDRHGATTRRWPCPTVDSPIPVTEVADASLPQ